MRIHLRTTHALLCIALLFSIPLLSVHLAQGYADLPFMLFGLGAYLTLLLSRKRDPTYIFLSALLVAQSVWVKTEGIPYVLLPWMGMVLLHGMTKELHWKQVCASVLLTLLFSLPWILFALLSGVGLTPHGGSDMKFAFHADAVRVAFESLFIHGSFGVWWYIIPVLIFLSFKKAGLFTYLWPFFTIVFTFFVYLCTPNMEYLLNGQSFDRQMFLPLALLLFASLWHLLPHCMENTEI